MSDKTVKPDALRLAEKALESYIDEVSSCVKNLRANAEDCRDNMESDDYSSMAVAKLSESLDEIERALAAAEELKVKIHSTIDKMEQMADDYLK